MPRPCHIQPSPPPAPRGRGFSWAAALCLALWAGAAGAQEAQILTAPRTPAVAEAERALARMRAARTEARRALEASVTFGPAVDVTVRDDPPRPAEVEAEGTLAAALTWAPRRNGILVAEARVLEARLDVADARREALHEALRAPAETGRARHFLRGARAELTAARAELHALRADVDASDAALRAARLDARAARLEVASRRRTLEAWRAAPARPPLPEGAAWPERPRFVLPEPAEVAASAAARARALRDGAAVALAERRARASWWDELEAEVAYHGTDARFGAQVGVDGGRPRAEAQAALAGTPRERWALSLSAEFRFGNDTPGALADAARARAAAERSRAARGAAWAADSREARAEARAREAAWDLAEERLALARESGDAADVADARHAARRAWLRYLNAVEDDLAHHEAPWRVRPPGAPR